MTSRRYSLEPFLTLTSWTYSQIQDVAACNGTEWRLRQTDGVTEYVADRIATAAGYHPHEVWPEMLDHAIADLGTQCAECGDPFAPTRAGHRFCSRNCQQRHNDRRRYQTDPTERERVRARRRRRYAANAEYERARERARYHANRNDQETAA